MIGSTTSGDIFLEVGGEKIAAALGYTEKPNAHGQYSIELHRVDATDDGIDLCGLSDFSLVICKPDGKIIYSGCQWSSIRESGVLGSMEIDRMVVVAERRKEAAP